MVWKFFFARQTSVSGQFLHMGDAYLQLLLFVHVFYTSVAFSINYAVSALAIQLCTKYMYYTLTLCIYIIITLHGWHRTSELFYMYARACLRAYVHSYKCACVCVCAYVHACVRACVHAGMCVCTVCVRASMWACTPSPYIYVDQSAPSTL